MPSAIPAVACHNMRPLKFILVFICFISCVDKTKQPEQDQSFKAFAQRTRLVDTGFMKMVKLNDITVCSSTITDIKKIGYNPVLTPKHQIDPLITSVNWQDEERNV